jgi:glutamate dehydrogenase (NAD(P)+)
MGSSGREEKAEALDRAASLAGLGPNVRLILSRPATELVISFPVKMDDERVEMFRGFRVQHQSALGPCLGGLRYHPSTDLKTMRELAAARTWQAALLGIPFGGSMGGIRLDPSRHTLTELERITRRFVFSLGTNVGPEFDVITPEVGTGPQIMSWILDTYLSTVPPQERNLSLHAVTGKPVEAGGSAGRDKAVGQGLVFVLQEWARLRGLKPEEISFFVQGFGTVGSWASRLLHCAGARLVAVEDLTGALCNPEGIDPDDLLNFSRRRAGIRGYPKARPMGHDEFLRTSATAFIPAALGGELSPAAASALQAKVVAEAACCASSCQTQEELRKRGIELLPDLLCAAGGTVVSYFEWLQNKRGERWDSESIDAGLKKRLLAAYGAMTEASAELGVDLRTAALVLALQTFRSVYEDRGLFP